MICKLYFNKAFFFNYEEKTTPEHISFKRKSGYFSFIVKITPLLEETD